MNRKNIYQIGISVVLLGMSVGYGVSHQVSVGAKYSAFTIQDESTSLTQFHSPFQYVYKSEGMTALVSSGMASSSPFSVKREQFWGHRENLSDSKIGLTFPFAKGKIFASGSYLLPAGGALLHESELKMEQALARQEFEFVQTRLRDGGKWNASVAGGNKVGNYVVSGGAGYFYNETFDNIKPGDFAMLSLGVSSKISEKLQLRLDLTSTLNRDTRYMGEAILRQGNAVTVSTSAKMKLSENRQVQAQITGIVNDRNRVGGEWEEQNSNRNTVSANVEYADLRKSGWTVSPVLGYEQLLDNKYEKQDPRFLQGHSRLEAGAKVGKKLSETLSLLNSASLYAGNHGLWGGSLGITLDFGVEKQ